jgi:hypothetical protein
MARGLLFMGNLLIVGGSPESEHHRSTSAQRELNGDATLLNRNATPSARQLN